MIRHSERFGQKELPILAPDYNSGRREIRKWLNEVHGRFLHPQKIKHKIDLYNKEDFVLNMENEIEGGFEELYKHDRKKLVMEAGLYFECDWAKDYDDPIEW